MVGEHMDKFRIIAEYVSEVNADISVLAVDTANVNLLIQETMVDYYILGNGTDKQMQALNEGVFSFIGEWINKLIEFITNIIEKIKDFFRSSGSGSSGSSVQERKYKAPTKQEELEKTINLSYVQYNRHFHDLMNVYFLDLKAITKKDIKIICSFSSDSFN